ncbi:hypothetical protein EHO57_13710 [Leptospira langatensis]|uniref:Uncharacterized protein n=1 Tax=Leptospira langatensis TaxID=2484983 RepID=A0A5R2ASP3_9LEPT|nr:hypothetical protein [Leptospira langatensis]TGJ99815.1 hypothetical protein EHO57_13710 [Leptospira langatensis]
MSKTSGKICMGTILAQSMVMREEREGMDDQIAEIKKLHPWMNGDQAECFKLYIDGIGGLHHFFGKVLPCGKGVEVKDTTNWLATYDASLLTFLVVSAHDRAIRMEIMPNNNKMLKFHFHKRKHAERNDLIWQRHPTIEEAIAVVRTNSR